MPELTSRRLRYERLTGSHAAVLHRLANDGHIARFLFDGESLPWEWAAEEIALSDALFERRGVGLWLVHERWARDAIGFGGFRVFPELDHEPQLLYALLEPYTNRGYATEIARTLTAHAHAQGLDPLVSAADEPNRASRRVLEKVGFREAGAVPGAFGAIVLYVHECCASAQLAGVERTLAVARTWDGEAAGDDERCVVHLAFGATELCVAVDAPWHGDRAPALPAGPCPRLWEYEVVEVFLLGDDERYLEVELGPHGHYLMLALHGRRHLLSPSPQGMPIFYSAEHHGRRWRGIARVPRRWLPPGLAHCNAYAIHGPAAARRHLAWQAVFGSSPDFHRLERFGPVLAV